MPICQSRRNAFPVVIRRTVVVLLSTLLAGASHTGVKPLRRLTSTREVQALTVIEAGWRYPVKLRGTVTYAEANREFFIEDKEGGVLVVRGPTARREVLTAGQTVEVTGVSTPGDFSPSVSGTSVRILSAGGLPRAKRIWFDKTQASLQDAHWIEFEGVVRSSQVRDGRLFLNVGSPGGTFVAIVRDYGHLGSNPLIDAKIAIRGVVRVISNRHRQATGILLHVPNADCIRVEAAGPSEPFVLPVQPSISIGQFQPGAIFNRRIHVRGMVVAVEPDRVMYISDPPGVLTVVPTSSCHLEAGERGDFVGFQGVLRSRPAIVDTICRSAGVGTTDNPLRTTVEEVIAPATNSRGTGQALSDATRFDLTLVELEGTFLDILPGRDSQTLMLGSGKIIFRATLPVNGRDSSPLPALGSRLRLTGLCIIEYDYFRGAESLRLLLRGPEDVAIISRAPWFDLRRALWCLALLAGLFVSALVWASVLRRQVVRQTLELRLANATLIQLSTHDPLTGVANRRKLDETLEAEFDRKRMLGTPLSVAMVDIDFFKSYNDTCGHQKGDGCLLSVAGALESVVRRDTDLVARYGGEEFVVVMPGMRPREAHRFGERMRSAIEKLDIRHPALGGTAHISVSIGVATCQDGKDCTVTDLVARADRALYRAKSQGRNQTVSLDFDIEKEPAEVLSEQSSTLAR
jgi:diguanylate cyclase (GGDEF)-like protein